MSRTFTLGLAAAGAFLALAAGTTATASASPAAESNDIGAMAVCARGHFCAWSGINFTGEKIDMVACNVDRYIPWLGRGSWINNQTGGARAQFKDNNKITRWTSDAPYTEDRDADWGWVNYVQAC
jgi:hypothetical protein